MSPGKMYGLLPKRQHRNKNDTREFCVTKTPFGFQDKEEELGIRGDTEKKAIQYSMLCVWDKKH